MPLDSQYLKQLIVLFLSVAAIAFLYTDPEVLNGLWEEEEENVDEEDLPLYMTNLYLDLLPSDQFYMYHLFMDNIDRNESNLLLDAFL